MFWQHCGSFLVFLLRELWLKPGISGKVIFNGHLSILLWILGNKSKYSMPSPTMPPCLQPNLDFSFLMFVFVLVGKVISNGRTSTNGDSLAPKSRVNPLFAQNQTQKNQMFWKMGVGQQSCFFSSKHPTTQNSQKTPKMNKKEWIDGKMKLSLCCDRYAPNVLLIH